MCSGSVASYWTAMSAFRSTLLLKSTVESLTTVLEPVYQHWSSQSKVASYPGPFKKSELVGLGTKLKVRLVSYDMH